MKNTIWRVYELVPEAYRQRFRNLKKTNNQTYVDFAREKEVRFDRWCMACKADSLSSVQNSCWWWSLKIVFQSEPEFT